MLGGLLRSSQEFSPVRPPFGASLRGVKQRVAVLPSVTGLASRCNFYDLQFAIMACKIQSLMNISIEYSIEDATFNQAFAKC
jgi:hypothetical protein